MDVVVFLALVVLGAVFLFSLFILIIICRRRYEYNRLLIAQSMRFSKLKQSDLDDIIQLGPHISQTLSSNQWVEELSGILEHCVAVLKLCHLLTERLAKISLDQINPQINEIICQATMRIMPRFEAVLRSLAAKNVDIRVIEARVASLVTVCWALVNPFLLINPKYVDSLDDLLKQMDFHHQSLQLTLEMAETELNSMASTSGLPLAIPASKQTLLTPPPKAPPDGQQISNPKTNSVNANGAVVTLRSVDEDCAGSSLLNCSNDEAPADPQIS